MSYTKQNWQSGDTISATKLNHMEDGIESASGEVLICNANVDTGVLDHTWQEIHDAGVVLLYSPLPPETGEGVTISVLSCVGDFGAGVYYVEFVDISTIAAEPKIYEFIADSTDGYPSPNDD